MDWIVDLFTGGSVAHSILVYSLVIALGVVLGKVKFFGISLGTTFVLFVGILMGHLGLQVDSGVLHFIREFGLILFIFSIGMQVGPGFFSSFKKGGLVLNGLAMLLIGLNIIVALIIYYGVGNVRLTDMVGILSGAVTNTPGLGAAQQTLLETHGAGAAVLNEAMSMGYAAAYPLGVVGIILSMILVKVFFGIKLEEESRQIEEDSEDSYLKPYCVTFEVTNELLAGSTVLRLSQMIDRNFVISRIQRADGSFVLPQSSTVIEMHDKLLIVMSQQDEGAFAMFVGPKVEMTWQDDPREVVSRRIVVTNSQYVGRKIGTLRLRMGYRLNATRVNRAGVDLLARPNLALQIGDRITVVGGLGDINRLASKLGNSLRRLNEPNMFTMFIGIFLGIVLGSIPFLLPGMTVPMKLGLAGGPLIVAILVSRFGYKMKLVTYTTSAANLLLREIGICLFLASVGIAAGKDFAATVFSETGALWVLYGFLITIIPLLIVGVLARWRHKLNYCTIIGLLSGATTDPPALAYANKVASNDAPAVAYSTVYPLTMFLRVITAQLLVLLLA